MSNDLEQREGESLAEWMKRVCAVVTATHQPLDQAKSHNELREKISAMLNVLSREFAVCPDGDALEHLEGIALRLDETLNLGSVAEFSDIERSFTALLMRSSLVMFAFDMSTDQSVEKAIVAKLAYAKSTSLQGNLYGEVSNRCAELEQTLTDVRRDMEKLRSRIIRKTKGI